jgi:hypothetical protein
MAANSGDRIQLRMMRGEVHNGSLRRAEKLYLGYYAVFFLLKRNYQHTQSNFNGLLVYKWC